MKQTNVLTRLERALNAHDLGALASCFDEDVVSEQPAHPARAFRGRDQVEGNWRQLFAAFPDLAARLVRSTVDGDVVWAEWDWHGHGPDGGSTNMRGITILGVNGERIRWVRFYMEPIEQGGGDIDTTIRQTVSEP